MSDATPPADGLWEETLRHFAVPWEGASVLVTGVGGEDLCDRLRKDHGVAETHAVEADGEWDEQASALGERAFEVIVSCDVLHGLTPSDQRSRLRWYADRLAPGGHLLVTTPTYLGVDGGGAKTATEGAHIVFPRRILRRYHEDRLGTPLDYASPQTASTYIMLFRRTGFEIVAARRGGTKLSEETRRRFADKLSVFPAGEIDGASIACHLRKREPADLDEIERASVESPPEIGLKLTWSALPDSHGYRVSRRGSEKNTVLWRGDDSECPVPILEDGTRDELRVEVKLSPDASYTTLAPFAVPTLAEKEAGAMWLGPPDDLEEELGTSTDAELFRGAMSAPNGEELELTIDRVYLAGREVGFLSHSQPTLEAEQGTLVVGERRRAVLYCSTDLGRSWTALSLLQHCSRPVDRHLLLSSGNHLVLARDPVEVFLFDPDGELISRFDGAEYGWHGSWSVDESEAGTVMFAEYRPTAEPVGGELRAWRSPDGGRTWSSTLSVPGRSPDAENFIRHFHTCQADPFHPGRWYVSSGDRGEECAFWISDDDGLSWRLAEPTYPEGMRPDLVARLLRTTSFQIRPDHLFWATDDNTNHGRAVSVRVDTEDWRVTVEEELGANLIRSLVGIGDDLSAAISESKQNPGAISIHLLDRKGASASQVALHNLRRRATGFTYSVASREAVDGTFFTPTDGSVLSTERDGFLRWRIRPQESPRPLPTDAGAWKRTLRRLSRIAGREPFAVVDGRTVGWFPIGFVPEEDDLIAFFHSQRTGGISFREQLRRAYGEEAVYSLTTLAGYRHWDKLSEADLEGYRAYAGHAAYLEKAMSRRWLAVSQMREPVSRIVSLYRMIRDSDDYSEKLSVDDEDLETWVRKVHERQPDYVSNSQTQFLCGAPDADYALDLICGRYLGVGLTEHADAFLAEMARTLRWPEPEPVHLNASKRSMDFEITDRARELILELNQEDQRVFEFVREAWRQRLG